MAQTSKKDTNTSDETRMETPEAIRKKEDMKKQSEGSSENRKNGRGKPKGSFWHRLKNFTAEAPKAVIIEGDTIRLVPISQETAVIEEFLEKETSILSEISVSVLPETIAGKDEAGSQTLAPPEEIVSVLPETAVVEEHIEEETSVSSEKLKKGLEKTRSRFWARLKNLFSFRRKIDESVLEELEDILIGADIGVKSVQKLVHELHEAWKSKTIIDVDLKRPQAFLESVFYKIIYL